MSLSRKILIIVLILVILLSAGYLWLRTTNRITESGTDAAVGTATSPTKTQEQNSPKLTESSFTREAETGPSLPKNAELSGAWNEQETLFLFWDAATEQVKVREADRNERLITPLRSLTEPLNFSWAPDSEHAIIADGRDLYVVGLKLGSRKKIVADFTASRFLWSPDSQEVLLQGSEAKVYKISMSAPGELLALDYSLDLNHSVWTKKGKLMSYEISGNTTKILLVDTQSGARGTIDEKIDFPVSDLYYESETSTGFLQNADTNTWYEIKIE